MQRTASGAALLLAGLASSLGHARAAAPAGGQTELAVVPLVGGDTDIGFGAGALGSVARLRPGLRPYLWRLEGSCFVTGRWQRSSFESPYQDVFLRLRVNGLFEDRVRLELRPSFTREANLRYYGLGNASVAPASDLAARDFFTRRHVAMLARAQLRLRGGWQALLGLANTYNWIRYGPDSNLARDLASDDATVTSLLNVDNAHAIVLLESGLLWDSRDDEIAPTSGQHHVLKARVSPGGTSWLPHRYGQADLSLRFYSSPWGPWLVLAARGVADVLVGQPPFYELSRYDEASAIGGANGVRGVPADRYYGKRKLFMNLELRAQLAELTVAGSRYGLGVVSFLDAGRVWADLDAAPALDRGGVPVKWGTGAGLRLRKGQTFVLRTDMAWSPDARPFGFYLLAGHTF
jgi:hypothetical protein